MLLKNMLTLYEKVEEMGIDVFCTKPSHIRDSYLSRLSSDEITCYFFFMNYEEFSKCFSNTIIKKCFRKIPYENLFILCHEIPASKFSSIMSSTIFLKKWNNISPSGMIDGFIQHSESIFSLVKHNYISYNDIYISFKEYPMSYLSIIYQQHKLCTILFKPLFTLLVTIFQTRSIPKDIVLHHIIPFLFYKQSHPYILHVLSM